MSKEIGFDKANFYLRTNNGVKKVSGYRLTNTIDGIAVRSLFGESSATDTASGMLVSTIKGSKEELAKALVSNGIIKKISELRKTDKYLKGCQAFAEEVKKFKATKEAESKSAAKTKSASKSASKSAKPNGKVDFEIKKGTRDGAFEVYFTSKPNREVLDVLKGIGFHWNCKKVCWYGFVAKADVERALKEAI